MPKVSYSHVGHLVRALRVVAVIEDPDLGDVLGYDQQVVLAAPLELPEPQVGTPESNPVPGGGEAEVVGGFGPDVVPELVETFLFVVDHVGIQDPVALPRPFRLEDGVFRSFPGDVDPTGHVLDPVDEPVVQEELALGPQLPDRSLPLDMVESLRQDGRAQRQAQQPEYDRPPLISGPSHHVGSSTCFIRFRSAVAVEV